ncbi:MAG: OmpA family protein [Thermoanaerobaculia bacterium]
MKKKLSAVLPLFLVSAVIFALEVPLNTVQFPERKSVDVPFSSTRQAPAGATLEGEVIAKGPQATVELEFRGLQPAVLFGGQINSYVVWAVARDGSAQNLGELWSRDENGKARFQTGLKEFAILVTGEPIPGSLRPSDLVVFISQPVKSKYAKNSQFAYSAFRPAVRRDVESIGSLRYREREPLELYQARRIYQTAELAGIADYDARSMSEARTTLAQAANSASSGGSSRVVADYSRRTVSLVSTAARAMWKAVAEREEAEIAAGRRAQLDALGRQVARAEQTAAEAEAARRRAEMEREQTAAQAEIARRRAELERDSAARAQSESEATAERLAREKQAAEQTAMASDEARRQAEEASRRSEDLRRRAEEERGAAERAQAAAAQQSAALEEQKNSAERARAEAAEQAAALERQRTQLTAEKETLAADRDRVQKDRDALQQRLSGALAGVATTRTTARGIVVSLPGILFETGRSTLKPSAQVGLAKMAGVLSVFPDMNLRVEGYTDSTGTEAVNQKLSRSRAASVSTFLQKQGIGASRIVAEGYGSQFPVASNKTPSGRARNRRVEVILAEGVVAAPAS